MYYYVANRGHLISNSSVLHPIEDGFWKGLLARPNLYLSHIDTIPQSKEANINRPFGLE